MSETTVIGTRVPVVDAERFKQHAGRVGLRPSAAVAALIRGALADEQPREPKDSEAR